MKHVGRKFSMFRTKAAVVVAGGAQPWRNNSVKPDGGKSLLQKGFQT